MMTLGEFGSLMVGGAAALEEGFPEVMDRAARIVQDEAKKEIGTYQGRTGPFPKWAPLAASTVAAKVRAGYSPPDNPLLRTGALRASIERSAEAFRAAVGSDADVAVWQELGASGPRGSHLPPRSFLGAAASRKSEEVADVVWGAYEAVLVGGGRVTRAVSSSFLRGMS